MKAAVCYEFGRPLVVEDIDIDPPKQGEVKVQMAATAICHSDVHQIRGEWGGITPLVAGHEAAGIVDTIGEGVTLVKPGDRVVVSLLRSCGRCFFCTTGSPHLCEGTFALQTESRFRNKRGETILQAQKTSAFAEYTIVDQSQLVPVPDDMPLDRAALLACGVITGLGAVVNTAHVEPGSSVVVIGAGGVGLNSVQGARIAGAHPIIAVDLLPHKLEAAMQFGATHTVNAKQPDAAAAVKQMTGGRGADYTFVTVGHPAAVAQGWEMMRKGGTLVIVGLPRVDDMMNVPITAFPWGARTVIGSSMGSTRLRVDVPRLVELYRSGRLKLDELITARYPLDEINEAIDTMEQGKVLRNVIVFE